jgi:hypothetical protein
MLSLTARPITLLGVGGNHYPIPVRELAIREGLTNGENAISVHLKHYLPPSYFRTLHVPSADQHILHTQMLASV